MSDDSEDLRLPPGRGTRKATAPFSSSDSESDDSVVALAACRKRMRVVSDEDTDSSGSSVGRPFTRRIRLLPQLQDSDNGSDASEDDSHKAIVTAAGPSTHASGFASDSSDSNSEKCSICLMRFTDQEVGTPETCEHIFCLDCITEWSKSVNTCPVDRLKFHSIVVRACAGGRVLRTEPVNVMPRRSSLDTLILFDSRICQICGDTNNEETMLLCDGCDLGYHMHCLNPPLSQIPIGDWHCPYCDNGVQDEDFSEIEREIERNFISDVEIDFLCPMGPRPSPLRLPRNVRRSERHSDRNRSSTSLRQTESSELASVPSSSRGSRSTAGSSSSSHNNIRRGTNVEYASRRRKYNKRRTKTLIIEYEKKGNNKRTVVKKLKRKIKKKSKKRHSRTAARQKHVRESVRSKLATFKMDHRQDLSQTSIASNEVQNLCIRRQRAGIPSLSLLGNPNQLDYFSEDEHEVSEGASTAVAIRSTSHLLSLNRQARRKMVTIPSPPHASSAPDFLSSILESQTLLHSKKSVLSISVDGNVNIKLKSNSPNSYQNKESLDNKKDGRLDLSKGIEGAKQAPSYPGHSRGGGGGGGGWGGGYRGNYHRERGTTGFGRGSYNEGDYPGAPQTRQGNHFHRNDAGHRDQPEMLTDYAPCTHRFSSANESQFDRNRRYSDSNRGFGHSGPRQNDALLHPAGPTHFTRPLHSTGAVPWRPYGPSPGARLPAPPLHRHSFGGFDDPLDMRTGAVQPRVLLRSPLRRPDSFIEDTRLPASQPCHPLPDPPVFSFDTGTDLDKSEDERSDPDLVIDTDKYDPTEPTHDDDSPDEEISIPAPQLQPCARALSPPPLPPEPPQADALRDVIASLDVNVPAALLDSAVRQVLQEHRDLLLPPPPPAPDAERNDEDSDGDCPNFSIYSATSVHIANNTSVLVPEQPLERPQDDLEDLVQEDDDGPSPTPAPVPNLDLDVTSKAPRQPPLTRHYNFDINAKKKSEEYKEKVSKRCPITTNTRNPIKIKLNTPSLIKRPVSLYDDDEEDVEEELPETQVLESLTKVESPAVIPKIKTNIPKFSIETSEEKTQEADVGTPENFKAIEETSGPVEMNDVNVLEELKDEECNINDINLQTNSNLQPDDDPHPITVDDKNVDKQEHPCTQTEKLNSSPENTKTSEIEDNTLEAEEQAVTTLPPTTTDTSEQNGEAPEKMTESISETEDERSYTPCLDENKSKDTSLETDKDKGIEGLDTEMISEDEGNEMFSDEDQPRSERSRASPPQVIPTAVAEEKRPTVKKQGKPDGETKKKKKKDSKKEGKDRSKNKRKADVVFRKLSKSGKERNYREREKQAAERERRGSTASAEREKRKRKRKEKRKDLERYDVRTVVGEKRRKRKDAFGRDVSPRVRSRSPSLSSPRRSPSLRRRSPTPRRRSPTPRRRSPTPRRRSPTPRRRSPTPRRCSPVLRRRSISPHRGSPAPRRRSPSLARRSQSIARVSLSPIIRRRRSQSGGRVSPSPRRGRRSRSPPSISPRAVSPRHIRTSSSRGRRLESRPDARRRRNELERARKRRRSVSVSKSPRPKPTKRKKRARSERATSRRRKSPRRRRVRRRSAGRGAEAVPVPAPAPESNAVAPAWSPDSLAESRPPSPCTPPPVLEQEDAPRRRRELERARHRRTRDAGGASKEVFTSGDNILVSVSFKEQERGEDTERKSRRKERRRRKRRTTAPELEGTLVRPVAIIDLERSPFRELTPSPRDVIVLSDSDVAEREASEPPSASAPAPTQQTSSTAPPPAETGPTPAPEERGPTTPPDPPDSPDAYDPYEPTRSASPSPSPSPAPPGSPPRTAITLETAQKTNMSADEVIDRRPLSPIEKVMALLQSTREVSPDPPPQDPSPAEMMTNIVSAAPALAPGTVPTTSSSGAAPVPPSSAVSGASAAPPVRIVLPEATRPQAPKLFLAKPSPIKSDPIKPMPKPTRPAPMEADSPYSPGSSDFGELFSPPGGARRDPFDALMDRTARRSGRTGHSGRSGGRSAAARVPVRLDRNKSKTQIGVKIDEDNLKILDDLPSSAVEMQVKSKFLKKLNRQERVVEEVKLVLKPHYNKKHLTKDEYKDVLRRAVPKICHNKSGEINPTKIQALIEAYVKKIRKKHKLGLL